jgi:hypothetical protein
MTLLRVCEKCQRALPEYLLASNKCFYCHFTTAMEIIDSQREHIEVCDALITMQKEKIANMGEGISRRDKLIENLEKMVALHEGEENV